MHQNKCLMIATSDNKKLFFVESDYKKIISFSKAFNLDISTVNLIKGDILNIDELAEKLCDASYKSQAAEYEIIETKKARQPRKLNPRNQILQSAEAVKKYVVDTLSAGNVISLNDLKINFPSLSVSALCNHVARVKKEMSQHGKRIVKVGAGKYALSAA